MKKEVTFEKALKYMEKDIVMESKELKKRCEKARYGQGKKGFLKMIADETPMSMRRIQQEMHLHFKDVEYIEIMSNAKFYVIMSY